MASLRPLLSGVSLIAVAAAAPAARADEPLMLRESWSGQHVAFSTGAAMAKDSDVDGRVDVLTQPAKVKVTKEDLPPKAKLTDAFLYWAGTQLPTKCKEKANLDDEVVFTAPGGLPTPVKADKCYCSSSMAYEMQLCRAEVSDLVTSLDGEYTVDQFAAVVANGDTDNASFALVLVVESKDLPERQIALHDGLLALSANTVASATVTLGDLKVSNLPSGDLTWYVIEGDISPGEGERVEVKGLPGNFLAELSDAWNPIDNPFNRTINTTAPPQKGVTGVDIDRFPLAPAMTGHDTSLEITYSAGIDKYWIAFNVVGIDITDVIGGDFTASSSKSWALGDDANGDGVASPGESVVYTIHVENTGDSAGVVKVSDPIPEAAASWLLGELAGGSDKSQEQVMVVDALYLDAGASIDITLTMVLADVPDLTEVVNVAHLDVGEGEGLDLAAPVLQVRRDGDEDSVFDSDDNCPEHPNPDQADMDMNGVGDACEGGGTTGTWTTGSTWTSDGSAGSDGSDGSTGMDDTSGTTGDDPTTSTTGDGDPTDAVVTSDGAAATGGPASAEEEGCACGSAGGPAPSLALVLLGGIGLLRRRRA